MTKAPSRLSPYKNLRRATDRKNIVLKKMYEAGFIGNKEYTDAMEITIALAPFKTYEKKTGYYIDYVKQSLEEHVEDPRDIYTTGFNVETSISLKMTNYAYEAIERGIKAYMKQRPKTTPPEVALVAIEVKTGELKVLIGGRDFITSPYNRAVQAKRQPGSAFKPIIYLAALEQSYTPDTTLLDAPISFTNPYTGIVWRPRNYNNEYHGDVTMRRALELSLNTATVRLMEKVGIEYVIDLAKQMHINSKFEPNLSLSLGTTEVAPIELAAAYATIARGGTYLPPIAIKTITTIEGEKIHYEQALEEPIVLPEVAYALVDMMKGVIQRGTASAASKMPYYLAGKTGTTDDFRDAWFIGYSPNLLCAVWVGYDKKKNLAGRATAALPIWIHFMSKALQHYPNEDFNQDKIDEYYLW